MKYIVGIDEVGRGPLAGPVTVCAVLCEKNTYKKLKQNKNLPALGKDSKKLKSVEREIYAKFLKLLAKEKKIFFSSVSVSNNVIDNKGITFSINIALSGCLSKLKIDPKISQVLLDGGLKAPVVYLHQKTIIKGDEKEKIISWASILAKVTRDNYMKKVAKSYPVYKFEIHKGYGTAFHRQMIKSAGFSQIHRKTFCKRV